jgi:flagellar hook-associated protein 1 FlgK
MSLFGAINSSISGLNTASLGLQVVSNNVANANTPGYSAQLLNQAASMATKRGRFYIGTGVTVQGISQAGIRTLETQLRESIGDAESSQVQSQVYRQLEAVIGELGENDISTYMSRFFSALNDVAQQPESQAVRSVAVRQGLALTDKINFTYNEAVKLRNDIGKELANSASRVNSVLEEIDSLNTRIVAAKGGTGGEGSSSSLIDARRAALRELSSMMDIRVTDTDDGSVTISTTAGNSLLLTGRVSRVRPTTILNPDGTESAGLEYEMGEAKLKIQGGKLGGLQAAQSFITNDFLIKLRDMSQNLVHEFNKVHSTGQGLAGLTHVTSEESVNSSSKPLDEVGLPFPPQNGSLKVHVRDRGTGQVTSHDVLIRLGTRPATSLNDLASEISVIEGLNATINYRGQLEIGTTDPNSEFYFSDDTSGVLASLGINTFFSGAGPGNLGVSRAIQDSPMLLSTSRGGSGEDNEAILDLIAMENSPLSQLQDRSIRDHYEVMVGDVAQKSNFAKSLADTFAQYAATLEAESLSQTGVNLDEEAAKMLQYQRAYQASARVIQTANELFDVMMQL